MKIAYITAGAGNMYCGSCLRDNTLASALINAGHEILLIPTYTPTRTDEQNVSHEKVFLGGINVYLQQRWGFFRRTPLLVDRLFDIPSLLRLTTRWGVSVDPARLGNLTVSMLRGTRGFQRKEILKLVRFLEDEVRPEIVNLPNSLLIALAPAIKARMNVPICCTLQGEDLFLDGLGEPYRSESLQLIREHAAHVDAFVAVSDFGAQLMAGYLGIERRQIHVVPLGINLDGFSPRTGADQEPFTIGYLARIAPEKGLHILCEAYRHLRSRPGLPPSRLWAAGYLGPEHKSYFEDIQQKMNSWGLSGDFHYHGELDRRGKLAYLQNLSVLSVPGPYADPKGLFLLEAMASGVPVVQPRHGAFTEIVETAGGGILVDPDRPEGLAEGILELWLDPGKRRELGLRGSEGVRMHFSSARMLRKAEEVYQSLLKVESAITTANIGRNKVLEIRNLSKEYPTPAGPIQVLSDITLSLSAGDSVSIVGPSGSGKSTLLYILGALEPPTSGTVLLNGRNPFELDDRDLASFRNGQVGFVFQDHHLLPQCTVLENVLIPTLVGQDGDPSAQRRALDLIDQVGLSSRIHHRPAELSGGEKQRVALARALVQKPPLVLCDEPTGNLDHEATEAVANLLLELHRSQHTILIVVTHNLDLAQRFGLKYRLTDTCLRPI